MADLASFLQDRSPLPNIMPREMRQEPLGQGNLLSRFLQSFGQPSLDALERGYRGEATPQEIAKTFLETGPVGPLGMIKAPKASVGSVFDWSNPGGGSRETTVGNTTVTYGLSKDPYGPHAEVILVSTPRQHRGQGSARAAMQQFVDEADQNGVRLFLNADPMDAGVSRSGLDRLYRSVGFVKNTGRKKDFTSRAAYVRYPQSRPPE